MNAETQYIVEELKMLSASDLNLRERIDGMIRFYLTGLAALVTASIAAVEYLTSYTLIAVALGLSALGIFSLGTFVFFRILHIRYRRLETKAMFFELRRMLVGQGINAAGRLSLRRPKNDLHITGRNGAMIFVLGVVSSLGLGLSVGSFVWSTVFWLTRAVVVAGVISMIAPLVVFSVVQTAYARRVDRIFSERRVVEEVGKLG
jgi:hypothetical protein